MFSHGFLMVRVRRINNGFIGLNGFWVRRINNGFIGLNGFWVRLQGGALVSARLCRLPEQEVHQPSKWMPSALLVQLRQLHPLEVSGCVGVARMPYPPTSASAICGSISSRRFCEFCVFCGRRLFRSENFSKKTLEPSAKPHANIVQVSAAKKFILEKWKSCF